MNRSALVFFVSLVAAAGNIGAQTLKVMMFNSSTMQWTDATSGGSPPALIAEPKLGVTHASA